MIISRIQWVWYIYKDSLSDWKPLHWYFGNQWRPRLNATWCSISSRSALFANTKLIFRERKKSVKECKEMTFIRFLLNKYCFFSALSMFQIFVYHQSSYVFSCINICRVPRKRFEHEADPVFKHFLRDPASVFAMKKNVRSLFLYILPDFNWNGT